MTSLASSARLDDALLTRLANWLVVVIAIVLPWSTSATAICIVAWLLVLLPTLDLASVRREVESAAGGLPVLLWCLGVVGMLWADVGWTERLHGLGSFHRLLAIPLLLAQFRRSNHVIPVVYGFLASSALAVIATYVLTLTPGLTWRGPRADGIAAHDDIFQGSVVVICGFGALAAGGRRRAIQKVELITQDTGGNPALAKTKTQELVERHKVPVMIGPLATNDAIAMDGYICETRADSGHVEA